MAHTPMEKLRQRILVRYPHGGEDMTQEMKDMQSWLIGEIDWDGIPQERQMVIDAYNQGYRDGEESESKDVKKDVQYFDDANNYFINTFKK